MNEFQDDSPGSLDNLFDVLSDERRRFALHCLKKHGTPLSLADLAEEVVALENDAPMTEIPREDVKETYMSLYHTHVPKMKAAGLLHYDQDTDSVVLSDTDDSLEQCADFLRAG